MRLCECGCGLEVVERFIRGHNLRLDNPMKHANVIAKVSLTRKGRPPPNKGRRGEIAWNKGLKGVVKPNRGSFSSSHIPWNKDKAGIIPSWNKGKHNVYSKETLDKMSLAKKGKPTWNKGKHLSDAHRKKVASPENVRKRMLAMNIHPNKPEALLLELIQENHLPFKYVGNGEIIIERKCPDFININGKKQVIELYGDYWHKGEDSQARVNIFASYGFTTLIIWEHELKYPEKVITKLKEFMQ